MKRNKVRAVRTNFDNHNHRNTHKDRQVMWRPAGISEHFPSTCLGYRRGPRVCSLVSALCLYGAGLVSDPRVCSHACTARQSESITLVSAHLSTARVRRRPRVCSKESLKTRPPNKQARDPPKKKQTRDPQKADTRPRAVL